MEGWLLCNYKKCRKPLKNRAWVSTCSHIFCDEDGTRHFQKDQNLNCPTCDTSLTGKFDLVRVDLQPTEQYKSIVLAGHRPETIMDICSRAVSFWTYQTDQERAYQDHVVSKTKEKNCQLSQYYDSVLSRSHTEIENLRSRKKALEKDVEYIKKQYNECQEKVLEKSRQYQKLQMLFDSMKRKVVPAHSYDVMESHPQEVVTPNVSRGQFTIEPYTISEDHIMKPVHQGMVVDRRQSPPQRDFVLQPKVTPLLGSENLGSNHGNSFGRYSLGPGGDNISTPRKDLHGNKRLSIKTTNDLF